MSGTSMASPHVAGAAALLWSGLTRLKGQIDATEQLLKSTARPRDYTACGDPPGVPNNGFGHGILDVFSAFRRAKAFTFAPEMLLLLGD